MKTFFLVTLLSGATLFANPFASQSDLTADLSDSVLNGIYHHRLGTCPTDQNLWVDIFGSYRDRDSNHYRADYDLGHGGLLVGYNWTLSCNTFFNLFIGGSWGSVDIDHETNFDTSSFLIGATWERVCFDSFWGFTFLTGFLNEDRHFHGVHEEPRGIFLSPELTYSTYLHCSWFDPIATGTIRYAGFFSRDYQHRQTLGTLNVQERTIQLITLRGELAAPLFCGAFWPYIGVAGRFQMDGSTITGKRVSGEDFFSDGIDNSIGYGFLGIRTSRNWNCWGLQANLEWSLDTDESWRLLGELNLSYRY